jgi:hypothetical protein
MLQYEGLHGTAFPSSPYERMCFYRDDLHTWFIWDGTAWVSLQAAGGGGDVVGPAGAVGSDIAEFDGVTGKLIKDGGLTHVTVADAVAKRHTQNTDTGLAAVGTKNPPIDADKPLYRDSTAADALVTSTWTQVKAFLKTYFDTVYDALGAAAAALAAALAALAAHVGTTAAGIHGSAVAAAINTLIHRDAAGRAQIANPAVNADIDNMGSRDTAIATGIAAVNFLSLPDTPASYAGEAGKTAAVNGAETAMEFNGEAHRTWKWTDEATWYKTPFLPLAYSGKWTKYGSTVIPNLVYGTGDPCPIYDPDLAPHPWRMYLLKVVFIGGVLYSYTFYRYKSADHITWIDEGILQVDSGGLKDFNNSNLGVNQIRSPSVIKDIDESNPNKRWKMWFNEMAGGGPTYSTWYCYSADGFNWSTPVLAIAAGTYYYGCPVLRAGNMYIMLLPNSSWQIYLLIGENETTWHSHGLVIDKGPGGSWDDGLVRDPCLVYISGVFYGLYSGRDAGAVAEQAGMAFGVFTSTTKLLNFSKYVDNPIIPVGAGGSFDDKQAAQPRIIMLDRQYICFYVASKAVGGNQGISFATIP